MSVKFEIIDVFKTQINKKLGYVEDDYCCVVRGAPKNSNIKCDLWFVWALSKKTTAWPCKVVYDNGSFEYDWTGELGYPIDEDEQIEIFSQINNFPNLLHET